MKMKKVYIIHGWGESSESIPWYNWIKRELIGKGFTVEVFDMPDSENPKIENWVDYLEKNIKDVDEETYFIGHSIGCQTIMRFLEKLHKHKKVAGCVFIVGWINLINLEKKELEIAHPWINSKIDFSRIKDHCTNFLAVFSDNDPYVHTDESDKFRNNLGAKIIIKKGKSHFENEESIPDVLNFFK